MGSGTSTTCTCRFPYQQLAFIVLLPAIPRLGGQDAGIGSSCSSTRSRCSWSAHRAVILPRGASLSPGRLALCRNDLAGLHHLLESPQIHLHRVLGVLTEPGSDGGAKRACRWTVLLIDGDQRAAFSWCRFKTNLTTMVYIRPLEGAPRNERVGRILGDFGIPFDRGAG